jgi:hypothetical protein
LEVATAVVVGSDPAATGVFNMSGGTLSAPTLSKGGVGSAFNLTGGTLHADTVNFTLVNNGGNIAPGVNTIQTHVVGDLALNSGAVSLDLASASVFDSLLVDGTATLGGALNISLLNSFAPTNGETWQIITAGGITGAFSSITAGYSVLHQGNNLMLLFGTAPLAGDYNHDGVVDAADYIVWRNSFGQTGSGLAADGDGSGTVDQADYDLWKMNFAATSPGSGAAASRAVPEPATIWLTIMGLITVAIWTGFAVQHRE